MNKYTIKEEQSFYADIYIAGDPSITKKVCREYCFNVGLCVTVEGCEFIYTGGAESGVKVGLKNYPRFPSDNDKIINQARDLARRLIEANSQWSAMVQTPNNVFWLTRREENYE